jgi:hypothetical protein
MKQSIMILSLIFTTALFAEFKVGEKLPDISLPDQFEKELQVKRTDKVLIIAFEKDISTAINNYLKTKDEHYLEKYHARYISDISAMPSFVTSMFAIPKMKKYPFSIMLIHDDFGKAFSKNEGKITVYKINKRKITAIEFINPDKLPALFKAL